MLSQYSVVLELLILVYSYQRKAIIIVTKAIVVNSIVSYLKALRAQ